MIPNKRRKVNWSGTEEQRIFRKIKILENGCWEWQGATAGGDGKPGDKYGVMKIAGSRKSIYVHRWSYMQYIGPIPPGLEPDHLCKNRRCFNPLHLEAVTHQINCLRGEGWSGLILSVLSALVAGTGNLFLAGFTFYAACYQTLKLVRQCRAEQQRARAMRIIHPIKADLDAPDDGRFRNN